MHRVSAAKFPDEDRELRINQSGIPIFRRSPCRRVHSAARPKGYDRRGRPRRPAFGVAQGTINVVAPKSSEMACIWKGKPPSVRSRMVSPARASRAYVRKQLDAS